MDVEVEFPLWFMILGSLLCIAATGLTISVLLVERDPLAVLPLGLGVGFSFAFLLLWIAWVREGLTLRRDH